MKNKWIRISPHINEKHKQIYDMVNSSDTELSALGIGLEKTTGLRAKHYVNEYTLKCLDLLVNKLKYFGVNVKTPKSERSTDLSLRYGGTLYGESLDNKIIDHETLYSSIRVKTNSYSYSKVDMLTTGLYKNKLGVWYKHRYK